MSGWSPSGRIRFVGAVKRDDRNSDSNVGNLGKLLVRKMWALSRTAGGIVEYSRLFVRSLWLEQLFLPRERLIQIRLYQIDSTLGLSDVKAGAEFRREQFVRDVQSGHHGYALAADDFSRALNVVHLAVEIGDGLEEGLALLLGACHAVAASEQAYFDRVCDVGGALVHRRISGGIADGIESALPSVR